MVLCCRNAPEMLKHNIFFLKRRSDWQINKITEFSNNGWRRQSRKKAGVGVGFNRWRWKGERQWQEVVGKRGDGGVAKHRRPRLAPLRERRWLRLIHTVTWVGLLHFTTMLLHTIPSYHDTLYYIMTIFRETFILSCIIGTIYNAYFNVYILTNKMEYQMPRVMQLININLINTYNIIWYETVHFKVNRHTFIASFTCKPL